MIWDRGSSKGNYEDRLYVHSHHCCFVVFSFYFKSNVHAKRVCQKPNEDQTRVQSLNSIHFITNDPFCSKWFALHILTIQALHFGEKKHVHYNQEMKLVYSNSNWISPAIGTQNHVWNSANISAHFWNSSHLTIWTFKPINHIIINYNKLLNVTTHYSTAVVTWNLSLSDLPPGPACRLTLSLTWCELTST